MRFAVAAPAAAGILIALTGDGLGKAEENIVLGPVQFTPVQVGFALVLVGLLAYAAFNVGGRLGVGPMSRLPTPDAARRSAARLARPRGLGPPGLGPRACRRPGWRRACS